MLEFFGYFSAAIIGMVLGLIGGGGSILTVPALVYLLNIEPVPATAYSLFIVGLSALVGSFSYMKRESVSYKTAVIFAIPAFIAVYATRKFIIPTVPEHLFTVFGLEITKDLAVMLLFAVLMIVSAYSMIRKKRGTQQDDEEREPEFNYPMIFIEGIVVGVLTGLVGAGGGFLIIPALVILAKLPMKMAVGTSLLIIAAKSLIGFLGDIGETPLDWTFLIVFSLLTVGGILAGAYFSKFISGSKLKPAFGWFVLVMGSFIIIKEVFYQ